MVNSLLARNAVMISENLVERYHARKEIYVRLTAVRGDSDELHAAFDAVKKRRQTGDSSADSYRTVGIYASGP